jgi:protein-disulfide isomerase
MKTSAKWIAPLMAVALLSACGKGGDSNSSGNASGNTAASGNATTAPAGTDWVSTVVKTPEFGYQMGNPDAAVKLIEYGALSCSHCANFSRESADPLRALIAKGTVSYEFRTFMLNILDVPTSILAKCNGDAAFFAVSERLYAGQAEWTGNAKNITPKDQSDWAALNEVELATKVAEKLELIPYVGRLGITPDRAKACLANPQAIEEMRQISKTGTEKYQISGTPTFLINGKNVGSMDKWEPIEKLLKEAGA